MKSLFVACMLCAAVAQAQPVVIGPNDEWYGGSRPNEPTQDDVLLIANSPSVEAIFNKLSKPAQVIVLREFAAAGKPLKVKS